MWDLDSAALRLDAPLPDCAVSARWRTASSSPRARAVAASTTAARKP
ncbi:hypothetical protein QNM99_02375 [Pseudomonas sp. PCH446]